MATSYFAGTLGQEDALLRRIMGGREALRDNLGRFNGSSPIVGDKNQPQYNQPYAVSLGGGGTARVIASRMGIPIGGGLLPSHGKAVMTKGYLGQIEKQIGLARSTGRSNIFVAGNQSSVAEAEKYVAEVKATQQRTATRKQVDANRAAAGKPGTPVATDYLNAVSALIPQNFQGGGFGQVIRTDKVAMQAAGWRWSDQGGWTHQSTLDTMTPEQAAPWTPLNRNII